MTDTCTFTWQPSATQKSLEEILGVELCDWHVWVPWAPVALISVSELLTLLLCIIIIAKNYPSEWFSGRGCSVQFSSVTQSVVSDSLQPHGLQHARPPCPSPTLEACSNSCHRGGDAIQPSHPLAAQIISNMRDLLELRLFLIWNREKSLGWE